jgi:hypothetical protein
MFKESLKLGSVTLNIVKGQKSLKNKYLRSREMNKK